MSTKTFIKIIHYKHTPKTQWVCLFFVLFVLGAIPALNGTPVLAVSADLTTAYSTDQKIFPGTLVSLSSKDKTKIEPTTKANSSEYIGVLVKNDDSTLAINSSSSKGQVATVGNVITLVSDEMGVINKGDLLAVSSLTGVATKAVGEGSRIVGVALQSFDLTSINNTKISAKISGNSSESYTVGPIEMQVFVKKNNSGGDTKPALITWVENASGRPVSISKFVIICGLVLALISSVTAMAYAAIKNTIVQSSRNPLAKPVIAGTLLRVVIIISAIAITGCALIYAIIKA